MLLSGEDFRDLLLEEGQFVGEPQSPSGEDDAGFNLRAEGEIVPAQPQLSQQFAERPGLRAGCGVVRDRVQSDIVIAFAEPVERVQSADRPMLLDAANLLVEVSQPRPGGEPRESRTNDDRVVSHRCLPLE